LAVEIRRRTDDDLDACVAIGNAVRELDGYPPYLPDNDFRVLLTQPSALAAYVAVDGRRIVGHVAFHAGRPNAATALASKVLQRPLTDIGVVARLFSAVDCRRAGVGRLLLQRATDEARQRSLVPILDVWIDLHAAIALYRASGWVNLGTVHAELPDGRVLAEHVLAAP
jgi:GNAT superfamily N-acetyltransferase